MSAICFCPCYSSPYSKSFLSVQKVFVAVHNCVGQLVALNFVNAGEATLLVIVLLCDDTIYGILFNILVEEGKFPPFCLSDIEMYSTILQLVVPPSNQ